MGPTLGSVSPQFAAGIWPCLARLRFFCPAAWGNCGKLTPTHTGLKTPRNQKKSKQWPRIVSDLVAIIGQARRSLAPITAG
jgi:hypothetical protein